MFIEWWMILFFIVVAGVWSELRYYDGKYCRKNISHEEYLKLTDNIIKESRYIGSLLMIDHLIKKNIILYKDGNLIGYNNNIYKLPEETDINKNT